MATALADRADALARDISAEQSARELQGHKVSEDMAPTEQPIEQMSIDLGEGLLDSSGSSAAHRSACGDYCRDYFFCCGCCGGCCGKYCGCCCYGPSGRRRYELRKKPAGELSTTQREFLVKENRVAAKGRACCALSWCAVVVATLLGVYATLECGSSAAESGANGGNATSGCGPGSCACSGDWTDPKCDDCTDCVNYCRSVDCTAGFDGSYTITGCYNSAHCGTFTRVAARCTTGDYCSGGEFELSGNTDPALCDGAPVYQKGGSDGPVLLRTSDGHWSVCDSSVLETCMGGVGWLGCYLLSSYGGGGEHAGPPTAAAYNRPRTGKGLFGTWTDEDAQHSQTPCDTKFGNTCGIEVTAGG